MKNRRRMRATRVTTGAGLLALAFASACAPKAARRQTDVMEKTGGLSVSAIVLRARVDELADRLAGRLERTADRIREESVDRAVRRRALDVKVDGIPAVYTAAYRADPLTGALDLWGFAFQVSHYLEDGAGRDAFTDHQALARDSARAAIADADALVSGIVVRPESFARARAKVEAWAREHPVEHRFASRATIATYMSELRSGEVDAFVAVGTASDTIENLSQRLNTYAALLPKEARWQAEILISETSGEHDIEGALGDIQAVGTAARRVNDLLGDVPGLVGAAGSPVRELIAGERRAVLAAVNDQRAQTLDYLTAERLAVLAAVREERGALLAALREERVAGLAEVDAIKTRAVDSAVAGLRTLIDYAFWRIAALLVFLMVSAATLAVVAYGLTIGRHRAGPS